MKYGRICSIYGDETLRLKKRKPRTMKFQGFGGPVMHSKSQKSLAVEPIFFSCFRPYPGIFERCVGLEVDEKYDVQRFGVAAKTMSIGGR